MTFLDFDEGFQADRFLKELFIKQTCLSGENLDCENKDFSE